MSGIASIQFTEPTLLISQPERRHALHRILIVRICVPHVRAVARHRTRTGSRRPPGAERRPAARRSDRRLFLRVSRRPPDVPEMRSRRPLVYERHIEGPEIDRYLAAQPTRWPTRRVDDRELPRSRPPCVRLPWMRVGLSDFADGTLHPMCTTLRVTSAEVIQFSAAGVISPTSLFFTKDGRLLVTPGCYEFDPRP